MMAATAELTIPSSGSPAAMRRRISVPEMSGESMPTTRVRSGRKPRAIASAWRIGASPARVASELFELWIAGAGVDLHLREPELVSTVSRRPRASPVARWHAIEGGPVTNAWHQEVLLPDTVVRFVLGRLDGETTTEMLARAVRERAREGERVSEVEALSLVEASLAILAKAGLLVG